MTTPAAAAVKLPAISLVTQAAAKPYSFKQGARKIKLASSLPAIFATNVDDELSSYVTEDWLQTYEAERRSFQSASVFCEVKLREIIEVTQFIGQPNKVRTAVCMDLLDMLISNGALKGAALQRLLTRLRDELMHSIYVAPRPGELLFPSRRAGLPTVLELIRRSEMFSVLQARRERNEKLRSQSEAVMRPLREARERLRPMRVVEVSCP
jgi:hypothetical protein